MVSGDLTDQQTARSFGRPSTPAPVSSHPGQVQAAAFCRLPPAGGALIRACAPASRGRRQVRLAARPAVSLTTLRKGTAVLTQKYRPSRTTCAMPPTSCRLCALSAWRLIGCRGQPCQPIMEAGRHPAGRRRSEPGGWPVGSAGAGLRPPEVPCAKRAGFAQRCRSSTGRKFPAMEPSKRFFVMEHPWMKNLDVTHR